MSEHAPKPKQPEAPTPPPTPEKGGLDPSVTLEFEPNVEPEERSALLEERLGADATLRGNEDMQGLDLTVWDNDGYSTRFVVTHASERQVNEPVDVMKRFSRPRIEGTLFKGPRSEDDERAARGEPLRTLPKFMGRHAFSRVKEEKTHKQVGLPRLVKRGGSREVTRKTVPINPVNKKFVTVDVYDWTGDFVETRTQPVEDLYAEAGEALMGDDGMKRPQAKWNWKGREKETASNPEDTLEIGLTRGGKPVSEDITEQLERNGITKWDGLTWQLEVPGARVLPSHHEKRKGSDAAKNGIGIRTRTQEVISDRAFKAYNPKGKGFDYSRVLTVRTTEEYEDGSKTIVDEKPFSDYELWNYLEKPTDVPNSVIWHVRMPDASKRRERHFDLSAIQNTETVWGLPKRPTLDDAAGILSYPELYDHSTEEGKAAHAEHKDWLKQGDKKKYAEELQETISEAGFVEFMTVANQIHGAVLSRAKRLHIEALPEHERSASWVVEDLMKKSLEARENGQEYPLDHLLSTPGFVEGFIDEHLGEMFGEASVISEQVKVRVDSDDDDKPKTEEKTIYRFNEDLFKQMPIPDAGPDSYGLLDSTLKKQDKIWGPIEELADEIYAYRVYVESNGEQKNGNGTPREITDEDYRKLGRMLSRILAE
jgi:hypothetical protein